MYYAYSLFGKNTSGIALAVNKTLDPKSPDFKWVDKGLVLESKAEDNFNAIDPNLYSRSQGAGLAGVWKFLGRHQDAGTWIRRPACSRRATRKLYSLARRVAAPDAAPAKPGLPPDWEAIEAPFLVFHGGYYYLFTSWDLCCRGVHSTYKTVVGRATNVTGPYVDESGKPLLEGGGTQLLTANSRWLGPGGESVFMGPHDEDLLVFHAYDAKTGRPSMQLSTIDWTGGWPHVALGAVRPAHVFDLFHVGPTVAGEAEAVDAQRGRSIVVAVVVVVDERGGGDTADGVGKDALAAGPDDIAVGAKQERAAAGSKVQAAAIDEGPLRAGGAGQR